MSEKLTIKDLLLFFKARNQIRSILRKPTLEEFRLNLANIAGNPVLSKKVLDAVIDLDRTSADLLTKEIPLEDDND